MTAAHESPIDEVRAVLFAAERSELETLKLEVARLQELRDTIAQQEQQLVLLRSTIAEQEQAIEHLSSSATTEQERSNEERTALRSTIAEQKQAIEHLSSSATTEQERSNEERTALRSTIAEQKQAIEEHAALIVETQGRMSAVSEVLVEAVEKSPHEQGRLGDALRPEIEHAVAVSAREDSVVLAEALYPVMGPAIRKMIAGLFTVESLTSRGGQPFTVDQALLIDRQSGLLLASSFSDEERADDADIVSGMLDAIRLFVQEAFDAADHDGLRDLRVGDTSVLVEWGPKAVLASVIRGVPTDQYRQQAAETLETLHLTYGDRLEDFDGEIAGFQPAASELDRLRQRSAAALKAEARKSTARRVAIGVTVIVLIILLLIWIL